METWIVAPHPDDEIIGCYSQLKAGQITGIAYFDVNGQPREDEAIFFCAQNRLDRFMCLGSIDRFLDWLRSMKDNTLYLPSPTDDHYVHRGVFYTSILSRRTFGKMVERVYVYSTKMRDFYVHDCSDPQGKREWLERYYPSQASLWQFDYRYFLFEGVVKL